MNYYTRRRFSVAAGAAIGAFALSPNAGAALDGRSKIEPCKLPFADSALGPAISAKTISYHYGKHHLGYAKTLEKLVEGTGYAEMELVEIVRRSAKDKNLPIFNNAAQLWNHDFYWTSLAPAGGGGTPSAALQAAIERSFGSLQQCRRMLIDAAVKRFGSGWAWLTSENGRLIVESTSNADTPIVRVNAKPLLVVDVWEHAYYLDWQNNRAGYVNAVVDGLLDWRAASRRFEGV